MTERYEPPSLLPNKRLALLVAVAGTLAVGWLDRATMEDASIALFYLVPIGLAAWQGGLRAGIGLGLLCAAISFVSGKLGAAHPNHPGLVAWNAVVQCSVFLAFATLVVLLRLYWKQEREIRELLSEKNRQLEEADRRKDEFLHVCSHDLRSPLVSTQAGCKLLLRGRDGALTPAQRETVELQTRSVEDALRLVDQLLDLGRIDAGREVLELSEFELGGLLAEAVRMHAPLADEGQVAVTLRPVSPPLPVRADRLKLLRVVNNLLSNAIKHSPGGTVEVSAQETAGSVDVAVRDTGRGLSQEDRARIFDRFTSLAARRKTRAEGTGLGLHISWVLTRMHGGEILVASEPGKGSTFTIRLPRRAKTECARASDVAAEAAPHREDAVAGTEG